MDFTNSGNSHNPPSNNSSRKSENPPPPPPPKKQTKKTCVDKVAYNQRDRCRTDQRIQTFVNQNFRFPQNIVGYLLERSSEPNSKDRFLGTCFFVAAKRVICSAHQFSQESITNIGQIMIKLPKDSSRNTQGQYLNFFDFWVEQIHISQKYNKYHFSKYDYAILKIKFNEQKINNERVQKVEITQQNMQKQQVINQRVEKIKIAVTKQIQQNVFTFIGGKNLGFVDFIPEQIQNKYISVRSLLLSKGNRYYYNQNLFSYDAYTIKGMSGGPIIIETKESSAIIGIHLYGNSLLQKNYGLLLTSQILKKITEKEIFQIPTAQNQQEYYLEQMNDIDPTFYQSRYQEQKLNLNLISVKQDLEHYQLISQRIKQVGKLQKQKQIKQLSKLLSLIKGSLRKFGSHSIDISWDNMQDLYYVNSQKIEFINAKFKYNILPKSKETLEKANNVYLKRFIQHNELYSSIGKDSLSQKQSKLYQKLLSQLRSINSQKQQIQSQSSLTFLDLKKVSEKILQIQKFQLRAQSYVNLIKLSNNKFTRRTFLRIYIAMIAQIYNGIKKCLNNQQFISLQKKISSSSTTQKDKKNTNYKSYKDTYIQKFDKNFLPVNQTIIEDLVKFEIIFIDNLYKVYFQQIIQTKKLKEKQHKYLSFTLFNQQLQLFDRRPHNYYEPLQREHQIQMQKDFKAIFDFIQQNQCLYLRQNVFKMRDLNPKERYKYAGQLKILAQIISTQNKTYIKGTGFYISNKLIVTARHNFGSLQSDKKCIQKKLKNYLIIHQDYQKPFGIKNVYLPREKQNAVDLIILELDRENQHLPKQMPHLLNFENFEYNNKQPFKNIGLMLGFIQQDGKAIHKITSGQINIDRFTSFQGQQMISGSPIFMKDGEGYVILGVYIGSYHGIHTQTKEQIINKGRYQRFDRQDFQDQVFQKLNISSVSANQKNILNKQNFCQFVEQNYQSLDHYLIKVISTMLQLNQTGIFFKQIKLSSLITGRQDSRDILFQYDKVLFTDSSLNFQQSRMANLQAFYLLAQQIKSAYENVKEYQKKINASIVMRQFAKNNYQANIISMKTLKSYIKQMTQKLRGHKDNQKNYLNIRSSIQCKSTMLQRHFQYKPKIRFRRLVKCYSLLRNNHHQAQKLQNKNLRAQNIKQYYLKRNQELKEKREYPYQSDFAKMISNIFQKGLQQFKQEKSISYKKYKNNFSEKISSYIGGIVDLPKQIIQLYRQDEQKEFEQNFSNVMVWNQIEEILQFYQCLQQVMNSQKDQTDTKKQNNQVKK